MNHFNYFRKVIKKLEHKIYGSDMEFIKINVIKLYICGFTTKLNNTSIFILYLFYIYFKFIL